MQSSDTRSLLRSFLKLVAVFWVVKVFLASRVQLLPEEAYYWNYSVHLAPGYLDHPPLSAWLIALGNWILGTNELGTRLATILCGLATSWLVYRLTRAVYGELAAVVSIAFSTFLPFFVGNALYASPDAPVAVCWAAALVLVVKIVSRPADQARMVDWLALGAILGLGLLSKYTIALLGVSIAVLFVTRRDLRVWFIRPQPYIAAIVALLFFSPVLYWNATHEWASLAFQSTRRLEEPSKFALHSYLSYFLVLATPVALLSVYRFVRERGERTAAVLLCWLAFLIPNLIFVLFSLRHPPRFNWPGLMLISLVPIVANGVAQALSDSSVSSRRLVTAWKVGLVASVVVFLGFWTYLGCGVPGVPYGSKMARLIGWEDLAREVSTQANAIHPSGDGRIVVVGMDKHYTPAELNFYLHKLAAQGGSSALPVVGRSVFGQESLMFNYWSAEVSVRRDDVLILVARSVEDLSSPAVVKQVADLSNVSEYVSQTNGKNSGRYYYRIGRGYGVQVSDPLHQ